MTRLRYANACLFVLLLGAARESDAQGASEVSRAIAEFQPPWVAPEGELKGIVAVLDPIVNGSRTPDDRRREELARMTPAYLFHLIKNAEGDAVVAQQGRAGTADNGGDSARELAELCATARCHFLLRIGFDPSVAAAVPSPAREDAGAGRETQLARKLAEALAEALEPSAVAVASSAVSGVPTVDVHLPMPAPAERNGFAVPPHRVRAEQLYKGIAAFVRASRAELEADRLKRWPGAATARSAIPHADVQPKAKVERAALAILPQGKLPLDKAAWCCSTFRAMALSDRTIVHFEPQATVEGETVVLRGTSSVAGLCRTMEQVLRLVGVEQVRNEMRTLPDRGRLGESLFGACAAPMALTFAKPSPMAQAQTQLLYGEPLFLLDRDRDYCLVEAGDGYCGWVRADAVHPMDAAQFGRYAAADQAVFLRDVDLAGTRIYRASRVPVTSRSGDSVKLMLPDGQGLDVPASAVRMADDFPVDEPIQAALKMLYVPYVFGGRSPIGLDCSGLVGSVSERAGYALPRDAAQQFTGGRLVATGWYREGLRAGDRVYFIDAAGKIYHTGLMISPTHFVHCSRPSVQISSLKKGDRLYVERWDQDFLAAKRP